MMKLLLFSIFALTAGVLANDPSSRIVRGEEATYGEHPYICSLQVKSGSSYRHICGCVIYKNSHVITAAHCVEGSTKASDIRIAAGSHNLHRTDYYQQHRFVSSIKLHEWYNVGGGGYPNDIAILKLASNLNFNSHVNAIAIDDGRYGNWAGTNCILSGWGRTSSGSLASVLQKATIRAISNSECQSRWSGISGASINREHICFYDGNYRSACGGDSGGPVSCGNVIAGVTSWGISTCNGRYPSVYTRLSSFNKWLSDNS